MYHYSSACYYLVKHGWLHVSTLLKVPLLQRQCLSHHGVVEQMKLQPWVKAAARRKVAASHGRFLHCDNEPSTVVIESESVFGFEMVIKGEAETESLEANTNMTAASFKPLVLVLVNDSWKRTAAFGVMKFLTLASELHSWVSSLWSSLVTLQISLVNVPLRCRLDKVACGTGVRDRRGPRQPFSSNCRGCQFARCCWRQLVFARRLECLSLLMICHASRIFLNPRVEQERTWPPPPSQPPMPSAPRSAAEKPPRL